MRSPRAASVALALVAVLALLAFVALGALSTRRQGATRNLESLRFDLELVAWGRAAISEVADGKRLGDAYGPADLQALAKAFRDGAKLGGILRPKGGSIQLEPAQTRARLPEGRIEVGLVTVAPVEHRLLERIGTWRFTVAVTAFAAGRRYTKEIAEDYSVCLDDRGSKLGFRISPVPLRRLLP